MAEGERLGLRARGPSRPLPAVRRAGRPGRPDGGVRGPRAVRRSPPPPPAVAGYGSPPGSRDRPVPRPGRRASPAGGRGAGHRGRRRRPAPVPVARPASVEPDPPARARGGTLRHPLVKPARAAPGRPGGHRGRRPGSPGSSRRRGPTSRRRSSQPSGSTASGWASGGSGSGIGSSPRTGTTTRGSACGSGWLYCGGCGSRRCGRTSWGSRISRSLPALLTRGPRRGRAARPWRGSTGGGDLHFDRTTADRLAFDAITRQLLLEAPVTAATAEAVVAVFDETPTDDPRGLLVDRLFPAHPVLLRGSPA